MGKLGICFVMFAVLFSCCGKTNTPKGVTIPADTVSFIIKDLKKAEYICNNAIVDEPTRNKMREDYKKSICNHYNVSVKEFDDNLWLYIKDGKQMEKILDKAERQ